MIGYLGDPSIRKKTSPELEGRLGLYVDAQNAFGAKLRSTYHCKVTFTPDGLRRTINDAYVNQ